MAATRLVPIKRIPTGALPPAQETMIDTEEGTVVANSPSLSVTLQNPDDENAATVTVVTPGTVNGLAIEDLEITLAPFGQEGASRIVGNLPVSTFGSDVLFQTDDDVYIVAYTS
ncbi:hypothetical protein PBI_HILLTOPFARM_128 [Mycobacterium phage Hilltopfarm]|nr:hypothetical protein PBI_HILLTOPFARM_128 [Mycobacterium phage Hilltopfarm]